ncbi:MAG: hypothetical protein H7Y38_19165 [Armatimonadetes bacterium]|nr:hypothetical protein [Armatimonadota bacterium]
MPNATTLPRRHWLADAATALAFFLLSYFLTRSTKGIAFLPLFVFLGTAGAGLAFARSAWRGVTQDRSAARLPPKG